MANLTAGLKKRAVFFCALLCLITGAAMPLRASLAASAPIGTVITNRVAAAYSDLSGNYVGTAEATVDTVVSAAPVLRVTKVAGASVVAMGGNLAYTIQYENTGNDTATGVTVIDTLSRHVTFVSATDSGVYASNPSGGTVTWNIGSVAVGGVTTLTLQVRAKTPADYAPGDPDTIADGTIIPNSVSIECSQGPTDSDTVSVTVGNAPNLELVKSVSSASVLPGESLTYTLDYQNTGNVTATAVQIRDILPTGTGLSSVIGGGVLSGGTLIWNPGNLLPGATGQVSFVLNVATSYPVGSSILNQATISSTQTGSILSNQVVSDVPSITPATITFLDAGGDPTHSFSVGNMICLSVTDYDQNQDRLSVETVQVTLEDIETGDIETLVLYETGPSTGEFRGCIPSAAVPPVSGDGQISVVIDSRLMATYRDPHDATPVYTEIVFIDPFGIVFDSVTGAPISGAVVTLIDDATDLPAILPFDPNPAITGVDGRFAFVFVPEGTYRLSVVPGGTYVFPSGVPDAELPPGFTIGVGSRGESFTLSAGMEPLNLDVPADPPQGQLYLTKTANKEVAYIGDLVMYTISIDNTGTSPVSAISINDILPHGMQYLKGSSRLDGQQVSDPLMSGTRTLVWTLPDVSAGQTLELKYRVVIGPDSQRGDGKNSAYATGRSVAEDIVSNRATFTVKIKEGVFTSEGTVIGKVFFDTDGDGMQEKGEEGVSAATLYLEDGRWVKTDKAGKFSIYGVTPGNHVLRLDETTLPKGAKPAATSNRFMGSTNSQFVDMDRGGLIKANFAAIKDDKDAQAGSQVKPDQSQDLAETEQAPKEKPVPLEEQISSMTQDAEILNVKDGDIASSDVINILVKGGLDDDLRLYVNDKEVSKKSIGKTVTESVKRIAIYEYVAVALEKGKKNSIRLQVSDQFGNDRGKAEISIKAPGKPKRIAVIADAKDLVADATSVVNFKVKVYDDENSLIQGTGIITVETSAGDFIGSDADALTPGWQAVYDKGEAVFSLQAPNTPVEAEIEVLYNGLADKQKIFFKPHLRPMLISGLGEFVLGHGSAGGDYDTMGDNWFDKGFYSGGRGAFFMKGELLKGTLLTAAYDSEKGTKDDLFDSKNDGFAPEDRYPIYGDESQLGYDAQSTKALYVRMDRNKSYLMYGDYETGLTDNKLSAYTRKLTGLKGEINWDKFSFKGFGSYTDQTQIVDELPARGVSGYYYLSSSQPIEGSERVVIETRDRNRTEYVLDKKTMSRGTDYDIDYDLGVVMFKEPIPSHDDNFNPNYIIVTYEGSTDGKKYYISGGRAAVRPVKWLEVGFTGIGEQKEAGDYSLFGSDFTLNLPYKTKIKGEYVQTEGLFDDGSAWKSMRDDSWLIELESNPFESLHISGYYRRVGEYFSNLSAVDALRGTEKYGFQATYALTKDLTLKAVYFDEQDKLNDMYHNKASIGLERSFKKIKLEAEFLHEESNDRYIPPTDPKSRYPFDNSLETPDNVTAVRFGLAAKIWKNLSLIFGHKQNISGTTYRVSEAGLECQIDPVTKAYVRQEYGVFEDATQTRTVGGLETALAKNTTAFSEYRLLDSIDGRRNEQSIGLRNKFALGEKITGNFTFENIKTLEGEEEDQVYPDSYAGTAAFEYLPKENVKFTSRFEYKYEEPGYSTLAETGLAYRFNPNYSFLFKQRYFFDKIDKANNNLISRTIFGLAYRPVLHDMFNALAKFEFKNEKNTADDFNNKAYIASLEGNYQLNKQLQISGKYAGKLSADKGFDAYTDLVSGRFTYDLTSRIDMGLCFRVLTSHDAPSRSYGGYAEAGYRVIENLWVSVGYAFDDFDSDLTGDDYYGKGPYVRVKFKFDEGLFKKPAKKNPA